MVSRLRILKPPCSSSAGISRFRSPKERWLWALIQRAGYGRAAVALANKNARTAWALLTQGEEYKREHEVPLAA